MSKLELLQKCKEAGIKCSSSKTKKELLLLLNGKDKEKSTISSNTFLNVLTELLIKIPKDKQRKVCRNCNELGHSVTGIDCKLNIEKNNKLRKQIKNYVMSKNILDDKGIDDYCIELCKSLDITPNLCKSLYYEIPVEDLLNRKIDLNAYINNIKTLYVKCHECNKDILNIQSNKEYLKKMLYVTFAGLNMKIHAN